MNGTCTIYMLLASHYIFLCSDVTAITKYGIIASIGTVRDIVWGCVVMQLCFSCLQQLDKARSQVKLRTEIVKCRKIVAFMIEKVV